MKKTKKTIISDYITYRAIECKNEDAIGNYERQITRFLEKAKNDFSNVDETYLTAHINKISNEYSQKSLNNIKPLLKNFIKWKFPNYSTRFRNLDKLCKTKKAGSSYTPEQMLSEKEFKKLIEAETDLFWRTFWLVFFYGCFRGIEVIRLKWEQISFDKDGTTIIKTHIKKNDTDAIKILPREITPIIKKWKSVNPSKLMFPSPRGDGEINPKTPNARLERLSKKVLGKKINPYLLRHSIATIGYGNEGVSEDDWAKQMGHSKSMKDFYQHLDEGERIKRAKKVWTTKKLPKEERDELEKKVNLLVRIVGQTAFKSEESFDKKTVEAVKKDIFELVELCKVNKVNP